jgi:hypothetical protein
VGGGATTGAARGHGEGERDRHEAADDEAGACTIPTHDEHRV